MQDSDWKKIKHFKKNEQPWGFGDPEKMNFQLLYFLDCFREYINCPILVRCGTQGVHKSNYHSLGNAVDILIDTKYKHPLDLFFDAERFPFTGIGIYPAAEYDKMMKPIGFHFDVRPVDDMPRGCIARRWIGIKCIKMNYYPLTYEFLETFGVFSWYDESPL